VNNLVELGEIAEFRNGLNFSKESYGKGCLMIGVTNFKNNFTPKYECLDEIIPDGVAKQADYLKKGDLLFVRSNGNKALVGRSLYIEKDIKALYSGFCIRARLINELIDPLFLAYYSRTKHFKKSISHADGTNINNLNQGILSDVKLPLYSKNKQICITAVLAALDKKIELNNKINTKLEAMAKLIYDYWFVQFDFPDANGKPYKSSGGKMVYNEALKREIPEGWEVKALTEELDVQYGFPFSTKLFNEENSGVPVVRIRDILNNSISLYSSEDVDDKYLLKKGDLLIGMDGNFHLNFWDKDDCYLNQRCVRIRKKSNSRVSHFQVLFQIEPYIKAREKNVSRTTVGHLSARDISSLKVLIPNSEKVLAKRKAFEAMLDKIVNSRNESQKLSELRDWLLPMLMNGQVTVKDA